MITADNKNVNATGKTMAVIGAGTIVVALSLSHPFYALGVALATPISWLLYRWQILAVSNLRGLPKHKATTRILTRSILRLVINLALLGLSILVGEAFLFGMLTGLLLQVIAQAGQAFYITLKKGGKA